MRASVMWSGPACGPVAADAATSPPARADRCGPCSCRRSRCRRRSRSARAGPCGCGLCCRSRAPGRRPGSPSSGWSSRRSSDMSAIRSEARSAAPEPIYHQAENPSRLSAFTLSARRPPRRSRAKTISAVWSYPGTHYRRSPPAAPRPPARRRCASARSCPGCRPA